MCLVGASAGLDPGDDNSNSASTRRASGAEANGGRHLARGLELQDRPRRQDPDADFGHCACLVLVLMDARFRYADSEIGTLPAVVNLAELPTNELSIQMMVLDFLPPIRERHDHRARGEQPASSIRRAEPQHPPP